MHASQSFIFHLIFSVVVNKEGGVIYMVMHLGEQGWRWGGNFEICVVFILINMKIEL